jgi:hypothetical protein
MTELRQVNYKDLRPGLVIYYRRRRELGGLYSRTVASLVDPQDPSKGYVATNGHRYGLQNAYIKGH